MSEIIYPPFCRDINQNYDNYSPSSLEDHLKRVLRYFSEFDYETDDIYKYQSLWGEFNELATNHKTESIRLLAICTSTEICRCFILVPEDQQRFISSKNFKALYKLVVNVIKTITPDDSYYGWKIHIFGRFIEQEMFSLMTFNAYLDSNFAEQMFQGMFKALYLLARNMDSAKDINKLVIIGLRQLIESAGGTVHLRIVLGAVLLPLINGTPTQRHIAKKCVPILNLSQFKCFCAIITHRIVLKESCNLFFNKELLIAERVILAVDNVEVFDSIIYIICREVLNFNDRDHEAILRILCALLQRYTENILGKWEYVELEVKKNIQLMVSRFMKAMLRGNLNTNVSILIQYGPNLLENSPCIEIKFYYFKIFKYCIKEADGKRRLKLISIFDRFIQDFNSNQAD